MHHTQKYKERRDVLFAQITDLITEVGYENLTVRGICNHLSISTGTFYHYFPEKGDLAFALFADIDEYFGTTVSEQFTDNEINNLIFYCVSYGVYATKNGVETCRCINMAPLKNSEANYLGEERAIYTVLESILIRGLHKNQFTLPSPTSEMARMILILIRGYTNDWAKRDGNYDLTKALDSFIQLFVKSITTT